LNELKNNINTAKTFLFSTLAGLKINFGGQLGVNEILALIDCFSISNWRKLYRHIPDIKRLNQAYFLILISQILSDIVNHSAPEDFVRGWANIIVALIVTNFLAKMLYINNSLIVTYLIGGIISLIIFKQAQDEMSLSDMGFFKFTLVPILNSIILIFSWKFLKKGNKSNKLLIFLFLGYAMFNIIFDSRSNGIIFLLMTIVMYNKAIIKRIKFRNNLHFILIGLFIFQCFYMVYVNQVLAGNVGGEHSKQQLSMTSNPYNPFYLLLIGRSEVYVALIAISDKPLFGHGSWAPDPTGKYKYLIYKLQDNEDRFEEAYKSSTQQFSIPSHSVIFGIWMTSGIIGFLAMIYIVFIFFKRGMYLLKLAAIQKSPNFPILLFYILSSFWIFLFSPLPHLKQTLPVMFAFVFVLYSTSTSKRNSVKTLTNE